MSSQELAARTASAVHADERYTDDVIAFFRPFRRTKAAPADIWLMAQPVTLDGQHVWVGDGSIFTLPEFRIAGLYAPANAEISTEPFVMPAAAATPSFYLNADAKWGSKLVTGGCDEGCAAYLMAELQDAATGDVIPGFEREKCILMDIDSNRIGLQWGSGGGGGGGGDGGDGHGPASRGASSSAASKAAAGQLVSLRIFFRDATIYSLSFT